MGIISYAIVLIPLVVVLLFVDSSSSNVIPEEMLVAVKEIKTEQEGLQVKVTTLEKQNFENGVKIGHLEAENAKIVAINSKNEAKIGLIEAENAKSMVINSKNEAKIHILEAENTKIIAKNAQNEEKINSLMTKNAEQEKEIFKLNTKIDEQLIQSSTIHPIKDEQYEALVIQFNELKVAMDLLEKKGDEYECKIQTLEDKNTENEAKIAEKDLKITQLEQNIAAQLEIINEHKLLTIEVEKLKAQISLLESKNAENTEKIAKREEEITNLKAEIESMLNSDNDSGPCNLTNIMKNKQMKKLIFEYLLARFMNFGKDFVGNEEAGQQTTISTTTTGTSTTTKPEILTVKPEPDECNETDSINGLVQAVVKALEGREELKDIRHYLNLTTNLNDDLPLQDGVGYTFFAPTNDAIESHILKDRSNPFSYDAELRRKVLLRHFARKDLSSEELEDFTSLEMADSSIAKLTDEGDDNFINDAKIQMEFIQLDPKQLGRIYVIDKFFTTHEEIEEAIGKNLPKKKSYRG